MWSRAGSMAGEAGRWRERRARRQYIEHRDASQRNSSLEKEFSGLKCQIMRCTNIPVDKYVGCVGPPEGGGFSIAGGRFLQIDHRVPKSDEGPLTLKITFHLHQLIVLGESREVREGEIMYQYCLSFDSPTHYNLKLHPPHQCRVQCL